MAEYIEIVGAREHNLQNIDLKIPRNKFVVITGLSGSGKSSLAFDTIFVEGQRRYIESFSSYARSFLGKLERPDVDQIKGLSPVISIEQKTVNRSPRSTVGTITEIYDYLRLLFARTSTAYSYNTGEPMIRYAPEELVSTIQKDYKDKKVSILAPLIKGRKGHYKELFERFRKLGFLKVRVDGFVHNLEPGLQVDRYKIHDIELVVDRIQVNLDDSKRIKESVNTALKYGKNSVVIFDHDSDAERFFSKLLMCPSSGIAYDEPAPNNFSFNSPYGACPKCNGLGKVPQVDIEKIFPSPSKTIRKGGIAPLGSYKSNWVFKQIEGLGTKYDFDLNTPVGDLKTEAVNVILNGVSEPFTVRVKSDIEPSFTVKFEGLINVIQRQYEEKPSKGIFKWAQSFMNKQICPECGGERLRKESLHFKIGPNNIAQLSAMNIIEFQGWLDKINSFYNEKNKIISEEIVKEIRNRVHFLLDVGLGYLSLDRSAASLSGGEAQRIRLATQIGSKLTNVMYILDEPSIGLHQRDNNRLIEALKQLNTMGNSILVVEHDKDIMIASDYLIDLGPFAGVHGGKIVAKGTPQEFLKLESLTADYLNGKKHITIPEDRREGNGKEMILKGARGNNLKSITAKLPLGKFICVTGVSGSGKSSLIDGTLYPILSQKLYRSQKEPLEYDSIKGLENIDKVIEIDQSPIGRTPRSNPATYTNIFNDIRALFASLPEAKIRGYKPGRFSFNVKGGRCEACGGGGKKVIEMNFLPDVYVLCETCNGKRYNRETLEVRYRGKSISDVLSMTVEEAYEFFENIPFVHSKIKALLDVGLGYIELGQSSTTLSGGEAQRVKLASELMKKSTGNTFYILDEPTTGLHFEDIRILLGVLEKIVDQGNTVLVIEHNLDVIKVADHIIDLGPEGGNEGGKIIAEGTPEQIAENPESITGKYLKQELSDLSLITSTE